MEALGKEEGDSAVCPWRRDSELRLSLQSLAFCPCRLVPWGGGSPGLALPTLGSRVGGSQDLEF